MAQSSQRFEPPRKPGRFSSGSYFVQFAQYKREADFAGFLLCAYASMHAFGVGASISAAALAIGFMAALLELEVGVRPKPRFFKQLGWLALATVLTAAHGYMMIRLPDQPKGESVSLVENGLRFGFIFVDSLFGGVRALWANGGYVWPRADALWVQGVYGLASCAIAIAGVLGLAVRYRRSRAPADLMAFGLVGFALLTLIIYVILIVYRIRTDHDGMAVVPFLIGSRYLVFPSFFILMAGAGLFVYAARAFGGLLSALLLMAGCGAVMSSYIFFVTLSPALWPHLHRDHQAAWDKIVSTARAEIDAGRPIKNVDLRQYDLEFQSDLKMRRQLLERSLGCKGCVRFEGEPPSTVPLQD